MKKYPTCVFNELYAMYFVFFYWIIQGVNLKNYVGLINKFLDKFPKNR